VPAQSKVGSDPGDDLTRLNVWNHSSGTRVGAHLCIRLRRTAGACSPITESVGHPHASIVVVSVSADGGQGGELAALLFHLLAADASYIELRASVHR